MSFSASLPPPPLPGVSGSDFRVRGRLSGDDNFNFTAQGDRLDLVQQFALNSQTVTASRNGGPASSTFSGRLQFPDYLGGRDVEDLALSGSLLPLSLGNSPTKSINLGPGQFEMAYSINGSAITGTGQFKPLSGSFSAGFSAGRDGVRFTTSGDTDWKEAYGQVCVTTYIPRHLNFDGSVIPGHNDTTCVEKSLDTVQMRFDWDLSVEIAPDWSGPQACVRGTFQVCPEGGSALSFPVPFDGESYRSVGSDGKVEINKAAQGFSKFLPKLW